MLSSVVDVKQCYYAVINKLLVKGIYNLGTYIYAVHPCTYR